MISPKEWASVWPCPRPTSPSTSTKPRKATLVFTSATSSSPEVTAFPERWGLMSKVAVHSVKSFSAVQWQILDRSCNWKMALDLKKTTTTTTTWCLDNRGGLKLSHLPKADGNYRERGRTIYLFSCSVPTALSSFHMASSRLTLMYMLKKRSVLLILISHMLSCSADSVNPSLQSLRLPRCAAWPGTPWWEATWLWAASPAMENLSLNTSGPKLPPRLRSSSPRSRVSTDVLRNIWRSNCGFCLVHFHICIYKIQF